MERVNESKLIEIWKEVLEIEELSMDKGFIDCGGHSMKAVGLSALLEQILKLDIPVRKLMENISLKELIKEAYRNQKYCDIKEEAYINPTSNEFPLLGSQKWIYCIQQKDEKSCSFHIPSCYLIEDEVDYNKLNESFKRIIRRHDALRTTITIRDLEPIQVVHDDIPFDVIWKKISDDTLDRQITDCMKPFDLSQGPLIRAYLLEVDKNINYLLIDAHHIIYDGYSQTILIRELLELYEGLDVAPLPVSYQAYLSSKTIHYSEHENKKREEYWINQFKDGIPELNLPLNYNATNKYCGDYINIDLSSGESERIIQLAKQLKTTTNLVMYVAYIVLLSKYTGQNDLVVGMVSAGRKSWELNNIIGNFIRILPIRSNIDPEQSFDQLLYKVKDKMIEALEHEDVLFENILDGLSNSERYNTSTLFKLLFIFHTEKLRNKTLLPTDMKVSQRQVNLNDAEMTIQLDVFIKEDNSIFMKVEYNTNLFTKMSIEKLFSYYTNMLIQISENYVIPIHSISLLDASEKHRVLFEFNDTYRDYSRSIIFHELFEQSASLYPHHDAIVYKDEKITYYELNKKSNQLANVLRQKGVGREKIVGILGESSIKAVICVLAILKSGGAFLPIERSYPRERIDNMLTDSQVSVLLTYEYKEQIPFSGEVINIDDSKLFTGNHENLAHVNTESDLLYVIYTSGTTGRPKGVMVEHRGLVNLAHIWLDEYRDMGVKMKLLQVANFSCDVFAGDLARAFADGGTIVISYKEINLDLPLVYRLMKEHRINFIESTPSFILPLMDYIYNNNLRADFIKVIATGSESCPIKRFKELNERFGNQSRIINSYGATEATVTSSYYEEQTGNLPTASNTPIGKPFPNTQFYILNSKLDPVPIGISGELYIGGVGVARGYRGDRKLTNQKFISNPFKDGEVIYNTGDLGRWLEDGNVEFLGRKDMQIKIRGYRVEIGEIESYLNRYTGIKEAVVVVKNADSYEDKILVAFIIAEHDVSTEDVKSYLGQYLISYTVPDYFVFLNSMPLTFNGKIDRMALQRYKIETNYSKSIVSPSNIVEENVTKIWMQLLKRKDISITDEFYSVGGNSYKVIIMVQKLSEVFKLQIPVQEIIENPSIKGIANYIIKEKLKGDI
ncbi:amino acid adenylation domain-containing protein [Enterocloster clostridioformis]